ncbi:hypothetical protein ACSRQO_000811, partial [Enterobacter hormaechei]
AKDRGFWCRFTVTRQRSLTAMQEPVKLKALALQQVQGLAESFRHGAVLTRDLAQVKGAEIQQV